MARVTLPKLIKSLETPKVVCQDGRVYWGDSSIILVDDPRLSGYFRRVYGLNMIGSGEDETYDLSEFEGCLEMVHSQDASQKLDINSIVQEVSEDQDVLKALAYSNLKFFDPDIEREQIAFGLSHSRKINAPYENMIWVDRLKAGYISEVFTRLQTQLFAVRTMREEWMHDIALTPWFLLSDHPSWLFYMINYEEVRAAIKLEENDADTISGVRLTAKTWEELFQTS